ncbi:hypothetical protein D3C81_1572550 [compost metagenome]
MHDGREQRQAGQELLTYEIVGGGGGEELSHQRLGQRFVLNRAGDQLIFNVLPLRGADEYLVGIEIAGRVALFQGLSQHLRRHIADGGALSGFVGRSTFLRQRCVSRLCHCHFPMTMWAMGSSPRVIHGRGACT